MLNQIKGLHHVTSLASSARGNNEFFTKTLGLRRVKKTVNFDDPERIEDALDYKAVAKRLIAFVGASEFQLVETLAERCAEILLREFGIRWVRLSLNKIGAVTGARDVGVLIERGERF